LLGERKEKVHARCCN